MRKTLYIIRHAQSAGKQAGSRDQDRKLTPQGESDAQRLGESLSVRLPKTIYALCSSASRTIHTWIAMAKAPILYGHACHVAPELYEGTVEDVEALVRSLPEEYDTIIIVGHNPSVSGFISNLTGKHHDLIPGACVGMEWEGAWNQPPQGTAVATFTWEP